MQTRTRWARNGALVGVALALADIIFEWRGQKYYPSWSGEQLAYNIGQLIAVIGIPALIGFVLGLFARKEKSDTAV